MRELPSLRSEQQGFACKYQFTLILPTVGPANYAYSLHEIRNCNAQIAY